MSHSTLQLATRKGETLYPVGIFSFLVFGSWLNFRYCIMTAAIVPQGVSDQFVLVGTPAEDLPAARAPVPAAHYDRRPATTGLTMDLFLLTGSLYLLLRTRRATLSPKNPFAWARSFVHVLEYLYFL